MSEAFLRYGHVSGHAMQSAEGASQLVQTRVGHTT